MKPIVLILLMFVVVSCGKSDNIINTNSGTQPIVSCSNDKSESAECLAPKTGTEYHSGSGTVLDPYILCEADEVQAVKDNPTSVFKVGSDIDLSSIANFIPIGGCSGDYTCGNGADDPFTGSFDGDGYCISNLTIDTNKNKVGFFGYVETNAVITNLKFEDASVKVEKSGSLLRQVGGVVGHANDNSNSHNIIISNINFHGEVQTNQNGDFGTSNIGGLLGYAYYSALSGLYLKKDSLVNVNGEAGFSSGISSTGGLVGGTYQSTLNNIKNQGRITVNNKGGTIHSVGGGVGYSPASLTSVGFFMGEHASVEINQSGGRDVSDISGLIGYTATHDITKSYSKGAVIVNSDGPVERISLCSNAFFGITDSYVSRGKIDINSSSTISHVGFVGGVIYNDNLYRNFVANSTMIVNGAPSRVGSFLGVAYGSNIQDSLVLNSPIPSYAGASSGSFVGTIDIGGNLANNFTSGDITETGTLNGNTAPGSIVASDVLGNDTHPVFTNWDFATVWEVVPGGLPKLRD